MPNPVRTPKRTWDLPGGQYFVTCVTRGRQPIFAKPADIALLSDTLHAAQALYPFRMIAYAYMPEHLHLLIHLAEATRIPQVMHSLKRNVTLNYKKAHGLTEVTSLWQPSYRERLITDDESLTWHIEYCHYNPIKHGLAREYGEYPYTSYGAYLDSGHYGYRP